MIPYGKQSIDESDITAVSEALHSDWLTTGPRVPAFEKAICDFVGAKHGVAVSSGTAALHVAYYAAGIGPGDEVIVPPLTFVADANAAIYLGAKPVFADVSQKNLLLDPELVEAKITPRTKAIVAVDYAGQPCDYQAFRELADKHKLIFIVDACHSIGAKYHGKSVSEYADMTVFSFHPVKHITTGEGGFIATGNEEFANRMRRFRNHGINTDHRQRAESGTWHYDMVDIGFNYRIADFQCALGMSQLKRLPQFLKRRNEIAAAYDKAFRDISCLVPVEKDPEIYHAYHLYPIRVDWKKLGKTKSEIFSALRTAGIHVAVHYPPLHLHTFYRERFGYKAGDFPLSELAYEQLLSIPMYPLMTDADIQTVIRVFRQLLG